MEMDKRINQVMDMDNKMEISHGMVMGNKAGF